MTRRTTYQVAGTPLLVEARDAWAAAAVDAFFARLHATRDDDRPAGTTDPQTAPAPLPRPVPAPAIAIAIGSGGAAVPIPAGLPAFEVAGGGRCYTDGRASYIDIDGSVVAIGARGAAAVEVRMDRPLPFEAPVLTHAVSYALSAALRRRQLFELHSGAVVDPVTGRGVLIAGPSGSGKSTLTVHLASAGWPFLTDDVLLLGAGEAEAGERDGEREGEAARDRERAGDREVVAWPLRRGFAITPETLSASRFLQARIGADAWEAREAPAHEKQLFLPHGIFAADFRDNCVPGTLVFPQLTGVGSSRIARLSPGETLARLLRMNPWSCYDRSTASDHLAVLSALVKQTSGYVLLAGRDLLDAEASVAAIASMARADRAAERRD